jgi:hypothetical protein
LKRCIYIALWASILVLLSSCITEPEYPRAEPWLCSINADGTGFRKIKKVDLNFGTNGFWDIYMNKDNRIIFYGEKLWISDADSISISQMTPDNLIVFNKPQLEFTQDGSSVFFAASRALYKLKLSTNEVFKIIETPLEYLDYTYAEPLLSDDENYITIRSYPYIAKDPIIVGAYIDLHDNSLKYVYSSALFPASYKTKFMASSNSLILENKDGFGSVNLQDSTYTLLQPYSASYKNMLEVSPDQRYLLTRDKQTASNINAIAIDLYNNTRYELGRINDHWSSNPIKISKNGNLVYFRDEYHIYKYDLGTHTKSTIFAPNSNNDVLEIFMLAPTWDGSKVFFYADISER